MFERYGLKFEWDESKNESNKASHGIDFHAATEVFRPGRLEVEDKRYHYGENRFKIIGKIGAEEVVVIYTMRDEVYRIISARPAWRDARRRMNTV